MAYFKPATLSFTAPRDFFDNVGKTAPVVRFNIELPREYADRSSATGDPSYNAEPVDPAIFAQIQTAVLRQYGGVARQCLGAFRQGVGLSDLAITGRMASLDNGVGMKYVAQFGRESVAINVSADAARKLLGSEGGLCMLVLYGDNQLAYVSMKELDSGFPNVGKWTYETRPASFWGEPDWWGTTGDFTDLGFMFNVIQMKFDTRFHVVFSNAKIIDGVINSNTQEYVENFNVRFGVYNAKNTIHDYVSPTLAAFDYSYLCIVGVNGSGTNVYDSLGNAYSIDSDGKISITYDRTADDKVGGFRYPTFVSSTGDRTGGYALYNGNNPSAEVGAYPYFTKAQKDIYDSISPDPAPEEFIFLNDFNWAVLESATCGPGSAVNVEYNYPDVESVTDPAFGTVYQWCLYPSASKTVSLKYPMYSSNGTVDIINSVNIDSTIAVSQSVGVDSFGYPSTISTTTTVSVPFYNFSHTKTVSGAWSWPGPNCTILSSDASLFPGYNNKSWGYLDFINYDDDAERISKVTTPYTGVQTNNDNWGIVELWHCSNGKHCLQSFFIRPTSVLDESGGTGGTRSAWLNGQDVTTALGAIGGGINNIRAVFFDIKLDDIKKLK
jgi:hypothetical protein